MKLLPKILLTLSAALFVTGAYAGTDAGKDSAKYYKTYPEKWEGNKISLDCVSVKRINSGPQIDGIAFFSAQTFDDKNNAQGGSIVVAVLDGDVESFIRKYGTAIERTPGGSDRVDNTSLRGVFHQLEKGHIYLDESGEAHAIILAHKEDAEGAIRHGDGIPTGGGDRHGHHGHKKHKK
jgi:hypothetical protein